VSRFRFVSEHRHAYGVKRLCRVLEVSRSGFYAWDGRPPSPRTIRDAELGELIDEVHRRSRRTYGAPRVHAELRRLDQRCSRKRVARLMRDAGLVGAHARRRWRRGRPDTAPAPDLVNRRFDPPGPDRVWAADVTQFRTGEGWLYLAGMIDLYTTTWNTRAELRTAVFDYIEAFYNPERIQHRLGHHSPATYETITAVA